MFEIGNEKPVQTGRRFFRMVRRHPWISVLIGVLIIGGLVFAFRSSQATTASSNSEKEKEKQERKLPVEVAQVKRGAISSFILTTASLDADRQVTVVSETNGIVEKIFVDEGDRVAEGQMLAQLADEEKKVALHKAEIQYENAKRELERKEKSWNEKIISKAEYDKAEYEKDVAEAERHKAKVDMDRAIIHAPFTGVVTTRFIEKGQNINPQAQLFTILDTDPLEARIYLPEKEVLALRPNQSVMLALNSQKDIRFQGQIKQINPAVDSKTGTVKVTVVVSNAPAAVRPGSFVDVRLVTQNHENALLVPKKAVVEEAGERFAFVINTDHAVRRAIQIGFTDDQNAEILWGLEAGDLVVTSGQGSLREGSKTEIIAKK